MSAGQASTGKWLFLRAWGVVAGLHVLYAITHGAVLFPSGTRDGTGGSWVYWADNPWVFVLLVGLFAGLAIAGFVVEPAGTDS